MLHHTAAVALRVDTACVSIRPLQLTGTMTCRTTCICGGEQGDEAEHVFLLRYGVVKEVNSAGRVAAVYRYGDIVGASAIAEVSLKACRGIRALGNTPTVALAGHLSP